MRLDFEQPYTGRLLTTANGGFFHNHTRGVYQVDQVARTPGIVLQHFNRDPNRPRVSEVMRDDPIMRETILQASRVTPIYLDNVDRTELADLAPHLPEGRFLLEVICAPEETDAVLAELRALVPPRWPATRLPNCSADSPARDSGELEHGGLDSPPYW